MIKKFIRAMKTLRVKSRSPLHIEFNLSDFCNLNCKGCTHYSPLATPEFQGLDALNDTMRRVSAIKGVEKIKEIFLIGGEPLLYPDLIEALGMTRKYFPKATLKLFTNGLLLPKMGEDFWEACRVNDFIIAITRYPIKFDYDMVEELCREKGVRVEVFGDRGADNSFFKLPLDPEKKQNGRLAHFRCFSYGCITIDNGKIFPCSQAACVGHLNRRFGMDFKWEKGDYIKVEDLKSVSQLQRLRNRPVPFCNYCRPIEVVKYETSGRKPEEWT